MNCQKIFEDFNSSKFVVYSSLLVFSILFALRLDGTINISWWSVFTPLWIWKSLVVLGAFTGVLVWIVKPEFRTSDSSYTHFKSMLISLSLQLLLLMFELLVCDKLETDRHFWTLAFIPLIFISVLSIAVSVWALKNERDFELELFCSVNVLQFVFVALRLDRFITWSWVVVFVPFWILLCLAIIAALYALIFSAILYRTPEVSLEQRRASFYTALAYTFVVLPLLMFFVLLSSKLDANSPPFLSEFQTYSLDHFPPSHHIKMQTVVVNHIGTLGKLHPKTLPVPSTSQTASTFPQTETTTAATVNSQADSFSPFSSLLPSNPAELSYFTVFTPLYFTLSLLVLMSFSSKGGNFWWFGMRKDFCSCILILCPCLREYANVSCNLLEDLGRRTRRAGSSLAEVRVELVTESITGRKNKAASGSVVTQQPNNGLYPLYPYPKLDLPD